MHANGHELPEVHSAFLSKALSYFQQDRRLVGLAVGGSFLTGSIDEYSDLDLVIGVEPDAYVEVLADRRNMASGIGSLLAAFTGEHVGEPRLLICLYGPPLLHVDLKFVSLTDASVRVEDPIILWERDERFHKALESGVAHYPQPDPHWIDERFWMWVHYCAGRIGRGELFEAINFLNYLRDEVLGPLCLVASGARPDGVRKIEWLAPQFTDQLRATVPSYDSHSCAEALLATVGLYRTLRTQWPKPVINDQAEDAALAYLEQIVTKFHRP
jgi:hypothetical protein